MPVVAEIRGKNRQFLRTVDESKRSLGELRKAAKFKLGLGGAIGITGLIAGLRQVAIEYDRIEKLSRQIGQNTDDVQRLDFIGSQNGVELESLAKALGTIDIRLGNLGKNREAAEALDRLGIGAREFIALSASEKLFRLARASDEAGDRTAFLADVYELAGRQGRELIQIISQSEQSLRDLAGRAGIVSAEDIRAITRMNDELDLYQNRLKTIGGQALGVGYDAFERVKSVGFGVGEFFSSLTGGEGDAIGRAVQAARDHYSDLKGELEENIDTAALTRVTDSLIKLGREVSEFEAQRAFGKLTLHEQVTVLADEVALREELADSAARQVEQLGRAGAEELRIKEAELTRLQARKELLESLDAEGKARKALADEQQQALQKLEGLRAERREAEDDSPAAEKLVEERLAAAGLRRRLQSLREQEPYASDDPDAGITPAELRREVVEVETLIEESLKRQRDLAKDADDARLKSAREKLAAEEEIASRQVSAAETALDRLRQASALTSFEASGGRFEDRSGIEEPFAGEADRLRTAIENGNRTLEAIKLALEQQEFIHEESQHGAG